MNKTMNGKFIVFEGLDGCGKSTQLRLFADYLKENNIDFITTREPGGTPIAEKIRDIIVNENIDAITEALLFASARREHVEKVIKPALAEGKIVLCDRFVFSSLAYQGFARGLGEKYIYDINFEAIKDVIPYAIVYLDIEPMDSLKRIKSNGREVNRLDNESLDFYTKCRNGFFKLREHYKNEFLTINANQEIEKVFEDIKKGLNII